MAAFDHHFAKNHTALHRRRRPARGFEPLETRHLLTTLAGVVYEDLDADGLAGDEEPRIPNVVLFIDNNQNGVLDRQGFGLEPDDFPQGAILSNARADILPIVAGPNNAPTSSLVFTHYDRRRSTTGNHVFGMEEHSLWSNQERLRFDFSTTVDSVSLDVAGASGSASTIVHLDAFDLDGKLVTRHAVNELLTGKVAHLEVQRAQADIKFVIAYVSSARGMVKFDNLRANDATDERATITDELGFYRFAGIEQDSNLFVTQDVPVGYRQTSPANGRPNEVRSTAQAVSNINFGNNTSSLGGLVFEDVGVVGLHEVGFDRPLEGVGVYLDSNTNGVPDTELFSVDPGAYAPGQRLRHVVDGIEVTVAGANDQPTSASVVAYVDPKVSQDGHIFTRDRQTNWDDLHRLRADFATPVSTVSLDFIAAADVGTERGVLIAYSATGEELASVTTDFLQKRQRETMTIERQGFDISYVIAYTSDSLTGDGRLDDLVVSMVTEPIAITNVDGDYLFKPLDDGDYLVAPLPIHRQTVTVPIDEVAQINLEPDESQLEIDFGLRRDSVAPIANDDQATTVEDEVVSIAVLINDLDLDGVLDFSSVEITQVPANGEAVVDVDGVVQYEPSIDFHGQDTFIYTVRDDEGLVSDSALVTIVVEPVNDAPVAEDDVVTIRGLATTVINVLSNDTDVDSALDRSSVSILKQPTLGQIGTDPETGNITYTPGLFGADTFTYTVKDVEGLVSVAATVTVTNQSDGSSPVARNDTADTMEGSRVRIDVVENDLDPDGSIVPSSLTFVALPNHGTVNVVNGQADYQPNLGFIGSDMFTYQVRDNDGLASNIATVTVTMAERDFPYQNPINVHDVNADGFIIPRDVLLIINEINRREFSDSTTGAITRPPVFGQPPVAYFDVDGDGFVVPRDVLSVIQALNSDSEGAAEPPDDRAVAVAAVFADEFDVMDETDDNHSQPTANPTLNRLRYLRRQRA